MNTKQKLIKDYYTSLIISVILFIGLSVLVQVLNIIDISKYIFLYFAITIIYYLILKNSLQAYFNNKIARIDNEFKEKNEQYKRQNKEKYSVVFNVFNGKWYKNTSLLYIIAIIGIIIVYKVLK